MVLNHFFHVFNLNVKVGPVLSNRSMFLVSSYQLGNMVGLPVAAACIQGLY